MHFRKFKTDAFDVSDLPEFVMDSCSHTLNDAIGSGDGNRNKLSEAVVKIASELFA